MDEVHRYKESLQNGRCMYRHCRYRLGNDDVRTHMRRYHLVYDCPSCDMQFYLAQALGDHIHATEHYVACLVCREKFITKDDLHIHVRVTGHNRGQQQRFSTSRSSQSLREDPVLTPSNGNAKATSSWLPIPTENSPVTYNGQFPLVFKEMEGYKSATAFMEELIRPDTDYNRRCEDLVNRIKNFMENNTGLLVQKVFVGGSVGKMTNVLNHSDVDMIVFINDYPTMVEFQRNLDHVLETLERHVLKDLNWAREVEHIHTTHHAVQFKAKLKGYSDDVMMQVDLLPALDRLAQVSPLDLQHCRQYSGHEQRLNQGLKIIYKEMMTQTDKERQYYSVCFAEEQTKFVKSIPPYVRDVIRLLKYWKKTRNLPMKSYFLELLVIYKWQNIRQQSQNMPEYKLFTETISELININKMEITWPKKYVATDYCPLPERPVLLDPLNPFNNVAPSCDDVGQIVKGCQCLVNEIRFLYKENVKSGVYGEHTVVEIPSELDKHVRDRVQTVYTFDKTDDNSCGCVIL